MGMEFELWREADRSWYSAVFRVGDQIIIVSHSGVGVFQRKG